MAYDNNFTGAVFKNDRKRPGKKDPDLTGSAEVDGVHYWVDMWANNPKSIDGHPNPDYDPAKKSFFKLSFRHKEERRQQPRQPSQGQQRPQHRPPPPPPKGDEDQRDADGNYKF